MIALVRAEDVRLISDGTDGWISVPDIKIPPGVEWGASLTDHGIAVISLEHEGRTATLLLAGPYAIGLGTYYIATAPKRVLQALKNWLGDAEAMLFIHALRQSPVLRAWAKAQGFSLIRNSLGNPVGVMPPLTICGHSPVDLDGQDIEDAPELLDLE